MKRERSNLIDSHPALDSAVVVPAEDPLWYKDAVVYELHVRAFRDTDGNGTGDFRGLTEKLDYIQELGVTAVWLLPFWPSPWKDDGYDASDYCAVHKSFGTLEHFREFLGEAHGRGLRVITELVLNHTSDQHPWFLRSRSAPAGSRWRDFYVWSDTPEKYSGGTHHLQGLREVELDLGSSSEVVLLAPVLLAPAGPELRQPGRAAGHHGNRGFLARSGCGWSAPRRDTVSLRVRGHALREPPRNSHVPP
jgi:hypothetical protein